VTAPFDGALRGLLHDGLRVEPGMKVGDLDPMGDPSYCLEISDKALAVGGGVLEAVLSQTEIRRASPATETINFPSPRGKPSYAAASVGAAYGSTERIRHSCYKCAASPSW
jgi:hypothetical protein